MPSDGLIPVAEGIFVCPPTGEEIMHQCIVDDCQNKPRTNRAELCHKHYHRMYRHGSVERNGHKVVSPYTQKRAYRRVVRKGHPLADVHGRVYEHRYVLYETIGAGTHACHWCDKPVTWGSKGDPDLLVVDHLNGVEDDNSAENLVPSCTACNTGRAGQARAKHLRSLGYWSVNDTLRGAQARKPVIDPHYLAARSA